MRPREPANQTSDIRKIDQAAPRAAIVTTNSSNFKSSELVAQVSIETKRRVLNMHYMMPPKQNVVELMTCGETEQAIFPFLVQELKSCAMLPFVAQKESSGLISNRIWAAVKREVMTVLSEGVATAEDIDSIWKHQYVGNPQGPCEMMDAVGLDAVAFIEQHYAKERGLSTEQNVDYLDQKYVSKGRVGLKSDKGGLYPPRGHTVGVDGTALHRNDPILYYLDIGMESPDDPMNSGKIIVGSADGQYARTLMGKQHLPDGIDIFEGRIYWTCMGMPSKNDGTVQSCKMDGSDIQYLVPPGGVHTPKQLMIDNVNRKAYFSDREGMRTMRCDLDGNRLEVLVQTGDLEKTQEAHDQLSYCVGMAVDTQHGYFYWTQKGPLKGNKGRIFRAKTDMPSGESATKRSDVELLYSDLPEPIDLEIHDGYLYWTDRGELPAGNTINRVPLADLETNEPSAHNFKAISHNLHEAIGLKIDGRNGHIFATDFGGAIYRMNLDGTHKTKVHDGESAHTGIDLVYRN